MKFQIAIFINFPICIGNTSQYRTCTVILIAVTDNAHLKNTLKKSQTLTNTVILTRAPLKEDDASRAG